ncbi:hypothetical protein [Streptomyces sp. NPDC055287]
MGSLPTPRSRHARRLTVEAGLVAATWSAALDDPSDTAAVAADVRASLEADIAKAEFLEPGELDAAPAAERPHSPSPRSTQ